MKHSSFVESAGYSRFLAGALSRPWTTVMIAVIALTTITLSTLPFIGGEFMPKLEEGNLWIRAMMPNTVSFSYARQLADQMRLTFKKYPEVTDVVSQLGRPEDGTDPTSYFNCEFFVNLKPREYWRAGVDKPELVRQIEAELRQIPGVNYNFSQTIQDNVEEAMSGVKGENSIKLFGSNLEDLESTANRLAKIIGTVQGVADLSVLTELGQPNLLVRIDRERAARYGVRPGDVNGIVQATIGS